MEELDVWGKPRKLNPVWMGKGGGMDFSKLYSQKKKESEEEEISPQKEKNLSIATNWNAMIDGFLNGSQANQAAKKESKQDLKIEVGNPKFFIGETPDAYMFCNLEHKRNLYNLKLPKRVVYKGRNKLKLSQESWINFLYQHNQNKTQTRRLLDLELLTDLIFALDKHSGQNSLKQDIYQMFQSDFQTSNKFILGTKIEYIPFQADRIIHNFGTGPVSTYIRTAGLAGNIQELRRIRDVDVIYGLTGHPDPQKISQTWERAFGKKPYLSANKLGSSGEAQVQLLIGNMYVNISCRLKSSKGTTKAIRLNKANQ